MKQKQLLAAVAVLAMFVAAIGFVGSFVDADEPPAVGTVVEFGDEFVIEELTAETTVSTGNYYVVGTVNLSEADWASENPSLNIYLVNGAGLTLPTDIGTGDIIIYAAADGSETEAPTGYIYGLQGKAPAGTVVSYTSNDTITCIESSNVLTDAEYMIASGVSGSNKYYVNASITDEISDTSTTFTLENAATLILQNIDNEEVVDAVTITSSAAAQTVTAVVNGDNIDLTFADSNSLSIAVTAGSVKVLDYIPSAVTQGAYKSSLAAETIIFSDIDDLVSDSGVLAGTVKIEGQQSLDTATVTKNGGMIGLRPGSELTLNGELTLTNGAGFNGAGYLIIEGILNVETAQTVTTTWTISSNGVVNNKAIIDITGGQIDGLVNNLDGGVVKSDSQKTNEGFLYHAECLSDGEYIYLTSEVEYDFAAVNYGTDTVEITAGNQVGDGEVFKVYTSSTIVLSKPGDKITYDQYNGTVSIDLTTPVTAAAGIFTGSSVSITFVGETIKIRSATEIDADVKNEIAVEEGFFLIVPQTASLNLVDSGKITGDGELIVFGDISNNGQYDVPVTISKVTLFGYTDVEVAEIVKYAPGATKGSASAATVAEVEALFDVVDDVDYTGSEIGDMAITGTGKTLNVEDGTEINGNVSGVTIIGDIVIVSGSLSNVNVLGTVKVNDGSNDTVTITFDSDTAVNISIDYAATGAVLKSNVSDATIVLRDTAVLSLNNGVTVDDTTIAGITIDEFEAVSDLSISGERVIGGSFELNGSIESDASITLDTVVITGEGTITAPVEVNTSIFGGVISGDVDATGATITGTTFKAGSEVTTSVAVLDYMVDGTNTISTLSGDMAVTGKLDDVKVKIGAASVELKGITPGTGFAISSGSVQITGNFSIDDVSGSGIIDFTGASSELTLNDAVITGTGTICVDKVTIKGTVKIAEGVNIFVNDGCEILIYDANAKLEGVDADNAGTVTIDGGEIINNGTVSVAIDGDGSSLVVMSGTELLNHMTEFGTIILGDNITINADDVVIPEGVKIDLAGYTLKFTKDATIKGATIVDSFRMIGEDYIFGCVVVDGDVVLTLDSASVFADIDTLNDAEIRVVNSKHTQINMDSAGTILGAYGDTVELVGVTIHKNQTVMVYGDLVITGNVKVLDGGYVYILGNGTMDVKGDLNVAGKVYGLGDITVSGSMTVGNDTGTAGLYSLADVYIGEGASLTILKTKDKNSETFNTLDAVDVVVDGVLNVYGSVADSSIVMNGQLNFNGVSDGATISLGAGVSVTVASVTGTLYVTDTAAVADAYDEDGLQKNTVVVTGNKVTIQNAKNVTVAVDVTDSIKEYTKTNGDKEKFHIYITSMTVSGSIATVSDEDSASVTFEYSAVRDNKDATGSQSTDSNIISKINKLNSESFVGEIIIGKAVSVQIDADAEIESIVATAEGAKIVINNGEIVGLVTIGSKASSQSDVASSVICAYYTITVNQGTATEDETEYYSNLVDAIALGATVDDKEITLFSGHEISDVLEIPAGVTIVFDEGASMTIKSSGEVRVIATGVLDASARGTTITVEGVLIIDDKETGIEAPATFTYQVKTEDGSKITYTGILGALRNTESGTITLQQSAVINADAEIKEGVTLVVPKGVTLTVGKSDKKVTLTVNGTLEMQKGSAFATVGGGDYKPEIVIGEGIITIAEGSTGTIITYITDYVSYKLDTKTTALSNLTVAASKATFGDVTIVGSHSAGDIVFATAADAREPISITYSSTTVSGQRSPAVSVSSMKLVNASFTVSGADATFTGEIIGASAASDASIVLDGVKSIKIVQTYVVDATGTTQYLQIASAGYTGKVVIAEGTAYVGADGVSSLVVADGRANTLSVSEGATLVVPKDTTLTTSFVNGYRMFFVDGTVYVDAGTANIKNASISGIVQIEGDKTTITDSEITGTVQALEKATDVVAGKIKIGDGVSVGDAVTTIGANGTIIGEAEFVGTAKYMVIYSGADITAAKIEWSTATEKTTAKVTEFFINGVSYMTVYSGVNNTALTLANNLGIELVGYDTPKNTAGTDDSIDWYSDEALTQKVTSANVGDYSKIYTKFEISGVPGKVSVGTGIGFYIDGLKVNYYGEGAGSITLKIGEHTVFFDKETGYDVSNVKILFNGKEVSNNGKITITADMESFTLTVSGAVPSVTPTPEPTPIQPSEKDDGMGITEYLLIVLVILAAILVVVVAIRMMRN